MRHVGLFEKECAMALDKYLTAFFFLSEHKITVHLRSTVSTSEEMKISNSPFLKKEIYF